MKQLFLPQIGLYLVLPILFFLSLSFACQRHSSNENTLPTDEKVEKLLTDTKPLMFNNPDSAIALLKHTLDENQQRLPTKQIVEIYKQIGISYSIKKELKISDSIYEECMKLDGIEKDTIGRASIYINMGINQNKQGNTQQAIVYYTTAKSTLGNHAESDSYIDKINSNLALSYQELGKLDSAQYYFKQSLDAAVKKGDKGIEANSLLNIATILYRYKEYSEAEDNLRRSFDLYKEIGNKDGMIMACSNRAIVLKDINRTDDALKALQDAERVASESGIIAQLGSIYHTQAGLYLDKEQYVNSLQMLDKSLAIKEKFKDSIGIAHSYTARSTVYNRLKQYDKSLLYAYDAMRIAQKAQNLTLMTDLYANISTALAAQGKWDEALEASNARDALKDSIFSKEKFTAIQELKIKYETEKKDQDILLANEKVKQQRIVFFLLAIICLSVIIILFVLNYFQRKKIQAHILIIKQNEELSEYISKVNRLKESVSVSNGDVKSESVLDKSAEILPQLKHLFEVEKIYRTQGLNINMVAQRLNTNRDYLSKAINNNLEKSFNEYINYYRIEDAKEILKDQSNGKHLTYTMQTIADQVGFSGTSTFYTAFKQIVGVTPSEYKKAVKRMKEEE